jgi:hypothetical protein
MLVRATSFSALIRWANVAGFPDIVDALAEAVALPSPEHAPLTGREPANMKIGYLRLSSVLTPFSLQRESTWVDCTSSRFGADCAGE